MPKRATSPAPKAVAIYCRISRDQAGSGLGVARQEELCRDLAEGKGWPVARVYVDNDLSAYSGKLRPQYEAMVADLKAGAIDAVVAVDQDRLTRNLVELESFIELADRLGVPLANVSGDLDLSTSDGRFSARIMGAVARQESEKKSERLRRQRDQQARLGAAHGGIRRYGYTFDRRHGRSTLAVVESEAAVVREVADRVLAGESLRQIAIDLNRRGVPTVSGSVWRVTTLTTMLAGPHLAALRVHRGEVVGDADWPAILDRPTWERVRSALGDPRRHQAGRPPTHLLSGLLVCSRCGGRMHASRRADNGTRRYQCASGPGGGCGRTAVVAVPLETFVEAAVLHALDSEPMRKALDSTEDPDIASAVRGLAEAEAAMETLASDFYVERRISRREWLAAREGLEAQIAELRSAIVPPHAVRAGADFRQRWEQANVEQRRAVLGQVIESVMVQPGTPGRKAFDPNRIELRWRA